MPSGMRVAAAARGMVLLRTAAAAWAAAPAVVRQ